MDLAKHLLLGCTDTQNLTLFPTISFWKSLGLAQNEFGYTEQMLYFFLVLSGIHCCTPRLHRPQDCCINALPFEEGRQNKKAFQ